MRDACVKMFFREVSVYDVRRSEELKRRAQGKHGDFLQTETRIRWINSRVSLIKLSSFAQK